MQSNTFLSGSADCPGVTGMRVGYLVLVVATVLICLLLSNLLARYPRQEAHFDAVSTRETPPSICRGSLHTVCPALLDHNMLKHFLNITKASRGNRKAVGGGKLLLNLSKRGDPAFVAPTNLPVRYLVLEKTFCSVPDIQVIFYVHTAPANRKSRDIIRSTWGSPQWYPGVRHKVMFMLGRSATDQDLTSLQEESLMYHDLILADFVDSYHNLSYKAVTALHWLTEYCRRPRYVVKTDDDIFVNIFALSRFLNYTYNFSRKRGSYMKHTHAQVTTHGNIKELSGNLTSEEGKYESDRERGTADRPEFQCLVWTGMTVIRDKRSKWYVNPKDYKDKVYPPYCSGSAFFMTWPAAPALLRASTTSPFLWVDDAYLTGMLAAKAKVPLVHRNSLYELNGNKVPAVADLGGKGIPAQSPARRRHPQEHVGPSTEEGGRHILPRAHPTLTT
ncbi:beta-1,3-galactosyltransferase 4-like isoform X2 [Panulirus ornatus]|uniref:beta-1,3-galactosyltransferase 4-like isoform X2 n=1 Tax=Panulirus ornatus TaxID=150431 RepID=UPI003A839D48